MQVQNYPLWKVILGALVFSCTMKVDWFSKLDTSRFRLNSAPIQVSNGSTNLWPSPATSLRVKSLMTSMLVSSKGEKQEEEEEEVEHEHEHQELVQELEQEEDDVEEDQ